MRILLVLLLSLAALAEAETTSLYGGKLKAAIPPGLYNLTKQAIEEGYPKEHRPQHVFKNQLGDYSVAFNHMAKKVSPFELAEFHKALKEDIDRKLQGVQWLRSSLTKIKEREWYVLEFKCLREGYLIHNWVLGTSWNGRLLEVTVGAFDDVDPSLPANVNGLIQSLDLN